MKTPTEFVPLANARLSQETIDRIFEYLRASEVQTDDDAR